MSLKSEAFDLADQVVTSALHELRMAVNDAVKDYRERACWRLVMHGVMVRELKKTLEQRHREHRAAGFLPVRIGWHEDHRLHALAQCEANDTEKQLVALCMSRLPPK